MRRPGIRLAAFRRAHTGHHRGFTLVEAMVTVAILSILAALAMPSMRDFIQRKRVQGVAQELVTDFRYMKSQQQYARRRDTTVEVRFEENTEISCYAMYYRGGGTYKECDCLQSDADMCGPSEFDHRGEVFRLVRIPKSTGVVVRPGVLYQRLRLEGLNASPNRAAYTVTVENPQVGSIRVFTNATALPRQCVISGTFSGVGAC